MAIKKFDDICTRISLNIPPEYPWRWDDTFNTALVAFDRCDMDIIYFPITREFDRQWDIATIDKVPRHFYSYFNNAFGIIPGQEIFTAEDGSGLILFAVCWPWGDGKNVSLRVGLFSSADHHLQLNQDQIKTYLTEWFQL